MSYNPEKPQFWAPFSLPGRKVVKALGLLHTVTGLSSLDIVNTLRGHNAREVVYTEYSEEFPVSELIGTDGFAASRHLYKLRSCHPELEPTIECSWSTGEELGRRQNYRHSFVWRDGDSVMVDTWRSALSDDNYPIATVQVFRDFDEVDPDAYGHSGGNTLIVMGEEEKFRRKCVKAGKSLTEFAHRTTANMPDFEVGFIAQPRLRRR